VSQVSVTLWRLPYSSRRRYGRSAFNDEGGGGQLRLVNAVRIGMVRLGDQLRATDVVCNAHSSGGHHGVCMREGAQGPVRVVQGGDRTQPECIEPQVPVGQLFLTRLDEVGRWASTGGAGCGLRRNRNGTEVTLRSDSDSNRTT
jgi:hypothetical protein